MIFTGTPVLAFTSRAVCAILINWTFSSIFSSLAKSGSGRGFELSKLAGLPMIRWISATMSFVGAVARRVVSPRSFKAFSSFCRDERSSLPSASLALALLRNFGFNAANVASASRKRTSSAAITSFLEMPDTSVSFLPRYSFSSACMSL